MSIRAEIAAPDGTVEAGRDIDVLGYLRALTYRFEREGTECSCVLIYAEPDPEREGIYRPVVADDTGYEGIACVDDTARAALLALGHYEQSGDRRALRQARDWLSFVLYMQYPDGSFANFIRNAAGVRNATGATSIKGGYWWSVRAKWALARAYRLTGKDVYLRSYEACVLDPIPDGKIRALQALGEAELYAVLPSAERRASILDHCAAMVAPGGLPYFRDHPQTPRLMMWGYHQLHAVATAARVVDEPKLLAACRQTVNNLVEPAVRDRFWYSYPDKEKEGVCAYCVTPLLQGLAAMYRATEARRYRDLAEKAAEWFFGRNDADFPMYDETGRCRDGINHGIASENCGAESSIEAGLAELERRSLQSA